MTLTGMVVRVSTAPGAGDTRVFTVMVDGVATLATVTISDTAVQNSATFSVSVTAGQTISLRAEATGTPADTTDVYWSILAESVTTNYFVLFGGSGTSLSASANNFQQLQNGSGTWQTSAAPAAEVMPLNGTMTAFYANLSGTPGGAATYDFTVLADETATALTINYGSAESGIKSITGQSVSITAGQTVAFQSIPTSTPSVRRVFLSVPKRQR